MGWKNDAKNKSVAINPNVKGDRARPGIGRPNTANFEAGRSSATARTRRDTATVTTNRKK